MIHVEVLDATEVRKEWGRFIDSVVMHKPQFVKCSQDYVFAASLEMLADILAPYKLTVNIYQEEDGSVTASLEEIDIAVNGKNEKEVIDNLTADLVEYAKEYYDAYTLYSKAPNRKNHLPYIINIVSKNDINEVRELIRWQVGKI